MHTQFIKKKQLGLFHALSVMGLGNTSSCLRFFCSLLITKDIFLFSFFEWITTYTRDLIMSCTLHSSASPSHLFLSLEPFLFALVHLCTDKMGLILIEFESQQLSLFCPFHDFTKTLFTYSSEGTDTFISEPSLRMFIFHVLRRQVLWPKEISFIF